MPKKYKPSKKALKLLLIFPTFTLIPGYIFEGAEGNPTNEI